MRARVWTTERAEPKIWERLDYLHTVELLEPFRRWLKRQRSCPRDSRDLTQVMFAVLMPDAVEQSWQGISPGTMHLANLARAELRPHQLSLLRTVYTHGESIAFVQEVAEHYGVYLSDEAVRSRIRRAKAALFRAVLKAWRNAHGQDRPPKSNQA